MKGRRETIWKDQRKNFNHDSLASSLRKRDDDGNTKERNSDPIPLDLTTEILMRLPAKSLVRFRCVSKLWSSIIQRRYFINLFLTRSSTRPCLLVIFRDRENSYIFSLPHPENPGWESSSVANHVMTIPETERYFVYPSSLRGLICFESLGQFLICNSSTRQLMITTVPKSKSKSPACCHITRIYFGYDAVNDQYKVFCTSAGITTNAKLNSEHHVFVLGAGNSWRRIKSSVSHWPAMHGLCINGVLYYGAWTDLDSYVMVSFDVRSEKLNLIKVHVAAGDILRDESSTLINYQGKVALVDYSNLNFFGSFDLWTLEDAKKEKWSKMICILFPPFDGKTSFYVSGTILTGEIILAPDSPSNPLYVFFYDIKRSTIRRVEIKGIEDDVFMGLKRPGNGFLRISTLSDHVENITFL